MIPGLSASPRGARTSTPSYSETQASASTAGFPKLLNTARTSRSAFAIVSIQSCRSSMSPPSRPVQPAEWQENAIVELAAGRGGASSPRRTWAWPVPSSRSG